MKVEIRTPEFRGGGHLEMIQALFMGTLAFDDFCFGNIGIPGDIGAIGKVWRKFVGAAFFYSRPPAPKNREKGRRAALRHEYIWGLCTGGVEKFIQAKNEIRNLRLRRTPANRARGTALSSVQFSR